MLSVESSCGISDKCPQAQPVPLGPTLPSLAGLPSAACRKTRQPENELHSTLKLSNQDGRPETSRTKITHVYKSQLQIHYRENVRIQNFLESSSKHSFGSVETVV